MLLPSLVHMNFFMFTLWYFHHVKTKQGNTPKSVGPTFESCFKMWVPYFHTTLLSILCYTFDWKWVLLKSSLEPNWIIGCSSKLNSNLEQGVLSHFKQVQVFELDKYNLYNKKMTLILDKLLHIINITKSLFWTMCINWTN